MRARSEIVSLNQTIVDRLTGIPPMWEVPVSAVRQAREDGRSIFGPLQHSERASDEMLPTSRGDLPVRVFQPRSTPRGVYLHLHGGGWVLGGVHHQDPRLEQLADDTRQIVVSIDYRLAPEHPYPAGPDDCEAAALALVEVAHSRFGVTALTVGGESAGAHLALVTVLRLRDRHGIVPFRAANLLYGVYDLRLTPSARRYGDGPQVLTTPGIRWFIEQFAPGHPQDDPDLSPLFADLSDMPPAIFTIGTNDPLLDDTLFMHERWTSAGRESALAVIPDAPHAFDAFDIGAAAATRARIHSFLSERLE